MIDAVFKKVEDLKTLAHFSMTCRYFYCCGAYPIKFTRLRHLLSLADVQKLVHLGVFWKKKKIPQHRKDARLKTIQTYFDAADHALRRYREERRNIPHVAYSLLKTIVSHLIVPFLCYEYPFPTVRVRQVQKAFDAGVLHLSPNESCQLANMSGRCGNAKCGSSQDTHFPFHIRRQQTLDEFPSLWKTRWMPDVDDMMPIMFAKKFDCCGPTLGCWDCECMHELSLSSSPPQNFAFCDQCRKRGREQCGIPIYEHDLDGFQVYRCCPLWSLCTSHVCFRKGGFLYFGNEICKNWAQLNLTKPQRQYAEEYSLI